MGIHLTLSLFYNHPTHFLNIQENIFCWSQVLKNSVVYLFDIHIYIYIKKRQHSTLSFLPFASDRDEEKQNQQTALCCRRREVYSSQKMQSLWLTLHAIVICNLSQLSKWWTKQQPKRGIPGWLLCCSQTAVDLHLWSMMQWDPNVLIPLWLLVWFCS